MQQSIDDGLRSDQGYEARGIVAKIQPIGNLSRGPIIMSDPIYKYLTLDRGKGRDALLVQYVGPAPQTPEGDLDFTKCKEGDIVVNPGLLYRKRAWTDALMMEHLLALKTYRPKVIMTSDVDRSRPAQEIVIDPLNLSKQ